MSFQNDLFSDTEHAPSGLVGLQVVMPSRQCRECHCRAFTIGAGSGPHKASVTCTCGKHCGWISTESFNFISETVRLFGRPTEPIVVRMEAAHDL
jgi:hypothetical protein